MINKDWFVRSGEYKRKRKMLFLFPYAGGGASVFRNWQSKFEDVELICAQYPGRENRMNENPVNDFEKLLTNVYQSILPLISDGVPYYFFGHSLGTKIVYELTLKLQKQNHQLPKGIIVSAGRAPCYKEKNPIYHLENPKFLKELRRFSGTPNEILSNMEVMELFIPMLKADFELDEKYMNTQVIPVKTPILGLKGSKDKEVLTDEVYKWKDYTTENFDCKTVEGGHMFVNTNYEQVINYIMEFMEK